MKRIHVTNKPITELIDKTNLQADGIRGFFKPHGLWYADGNSWIEFAKDWDSTSKEHQYELDVDTSKLLVLRTRKEVIDFTDEYFLKDETISTELLEYGNVNWKAVAEKYMGIELPDYHKNNLRTMFLDRWGLRYMWVDAIDVPSGCIWNPAAINKIEKIDYLLVE